MNPRRSHRRHLLGRRSSYQIEALEKKRVGQQLQLSLPNRRYFSSSSPLSPRQVSKQLMAHLGLYSCLCRPASAVLI